MTFIEMIGFVISLGALFILAAKKAYDERRRRANPEEYEREEKAQAEKLKAFLQSIDMDMEESEDFEPEPKPVYRKPTPKYKPPQKSQQPAVNYGKAASPIENRKLSVNIEKQRSRTTSLADDVYNIPLGPSNPAGVHKQRESSSYAVKRVGEFKSNRALDILSGLKSRKDMVILQEIISKPKALQ